MSTLNKILIFAAGATIGSAVTWKLVKTKYEQIANDEINEMREHFKKKNGIKEENDEENEYEPDGNDISEYEEVLDETGYRNYSTKKEKEETNVETPYVISPEEFDDNEDYETVSLTLYEDGVLTDEMDNIIDDIDELVGEDSLNHFGEYEDDSVFVRNDERKTDYEILRDTRKFSDVYPD